MGYYDTEETLDGWNIDRNFKQVVDYAEILKSSTVPHERYAKLSVWVR